MKSTLQRISDLSDPTIATATLLAEFIARAIQARLASSPYQDLRNICCECQNGLLILSGTVPTYYLMQLAQTLAMTENSGLPIANRIEVRW